MSKYVNSIYTPNKRGRLGGSCFSKNKFGFYEKMNPFPSNPQTLSQLSRRAAFKTLSKGWSLLSAAQRTVWNNFGSQIMLATGNGSTHAATGYELYMLYNGNLQIAGTSLITAPVSTTPPSADTTFGVECSTTPGSEDISLNITPAIAATEKLIVMATPFLAKPSRKNNKNLLRVIGVLDHTFLTGGSIKTQYLSKYGLMTLTGQEVLYSVKRVNTENGVEGAESTCQTVGIA